MKKKPKAMPEKKKKTGGSRREKRQLRASKIQMKASNPKIFLKRMT